MIRSAVIALTLVIPQLAVTCVAGVARSPDEGHATSSLAFPAPPHTQADDAPARPAASGSHRTGAPCQAERSATGNAQVNCMAEDRPLTRDFELDQNESTTVVVGDKVVVAYNDLLGASFRNPPVKGIGYSVSLDGGRTFTDMGGPPTEPTVKPDVDPSLASDDEGNVWLEVLAWDVSVEPPLSEIALYEMPVGRVTFRLVSVPVATALPHNQDKGLLAVSRDGSGRRHFYITYTDYDGSAVQGPVALLDSTDTLSWRYTVLTSPALCEPASPAADPVAIGDRLYVSLHELDATACTTDPTVTAGAQEMLTVDVPTATVLNRATIALLHASGDAVDLGDPRCMAGQVIRTAPGREVRTASIQSAAGDHHGTLYVVWPDRPHGLGGDNLNATRIYLSYSTDGARSWSRPRVISGALSPVHMADRFQPAIVADAAGLHAMWYERIADPVGGPDLVRADRADLSLARHGAPPRVRNGGETALSTVPFALLPSSQSGCSIGDYNQIASNGERVVAAWTDLRNTQVNAEGVPVHQDDIFADTYEAEKAR